MKNIYRSLLIGLSFFLFSCGGGNPVNDKVTPLTSAQRDTVRSFSKQVSKLFSAMKYTNRNALGFNILGLDEIKSEEVEAMAKLLDMGGCKAVKSFPQIEANPSPALALLKLKAESVEVKYSGENCPVEFSYTAKVSLNGDRAEAVLSTKFQAKTEEFKTAYGIDSFEFNGSGNVGANGNAEAATFEGSTDGTGYVSTKTWGKVDLGLAGNGKVSVSKDKTYYGNVNLKAAMRFSEFTVIYEENVTYNGSSSPDTKITENGEAVSYSSLPYFY